MQHEFVPYKQTIQLKELGFDLPSISGYSIPDSDKIFANAILFQQAFRFLRNKYKVFHNIEFGSNVFWILYGYNEKDRTCQIINNNDGKYWSVYEDAELECLKLLIAHVQPIEKKTKK
jgi:hypothetical protein